MNKRRLYRLLFGLFFALVSYAITSLAANQQKLNQKQTLGDNVIPTSVTTQQVSPSPFPSIPQTAIQNKLPGTRAQVSKVVDGDTIDVIMNGQKKRVRLIGMNTPETVDPRRPVQCFGKEASNHARELLSGKTIYLEADPTQANTDKYNRLLRYVWLDAETNFNKLMIADGYAYEYTYDIPYKYQIEFKQAQQSAENAQRGLWSPSTCGGRK